MRLNNDIRETIRQVTVAVVIILIIGTLIMGAVVYTEERDENKKQAFFDGEPTYEGNLTDVQLRGVKYKKTVLEFDGGRTVIIEGNWLQDLEVGVYTELWVWETLSRPDVRIVQGD